jgi:hypothetical protein
VILAQGGLLAGDGESLDASGAPVVQGAPAPTAQARLVVQVSRWDRLKDMPGVMAGFARTAALAPRRPGPRMSPDPAWFAIAGTQAAARRLTSWWNRRDPSNGPSVGRGRGPLACRRTSRRCRI